MLTKNLTKYGKAYVDTFIPGSGIFISPKGIAERSGSVGFALTNWALCGFISFLGKFVTIEFFTLGLSDAFLSDYMTVFKLHSTK